MSSELSWIILGSSWMKKEISKMSYEASWMKK